jgi:hypothetical protein
MFALITSARIETDVVILLQLALTFALITSARIETGDGKWDNFQSVIFKAKTVCELSGHAIADHFADVGKMVEPGSGSQREIDHVMLTRYACYLIAQNGDSKRQPMQDKKIKKIVEVTCILRIFLRNSMFSICQLNVSGELNLIGSLHTALVLFLRLIVVVSFLVWIQ